MTAMQHAAYSFAAREYQALGLHGTPSASEYATLQGLVEKYLTRDYPSVFIADRRAAASYGVAEAVNVIVGTPGSGGIVGAIVGTVSTAAGAAESAAGVVVGTAEEAPGVVAGAAGDAVAAIVRAVELPGAALPVAAPVDSIGAFGSLTHALASSLPTALAAARRARSALVSLGR